MIITLQVLSLVEKGKAGPISLHTMLEGAMEYVRECKVDVKSTWTPTRHWMIMFHDHLDYLQKPPLGVKPNTKNHETMTLWMLSPVDLFYFIMCEDPRE